MNTIKTLIIAIVTMISLNVSAQETSRFVEIVTSTINETGNVTISGKTFKGGQSRSGSIYIMRTSNKSGKQYKAYLGIRTKEKHNTRYVWTNKDKSKYWYFIINAKTGYPKARYLKKK